MKTKLFTLLLAVAASAGTIFAESGTCGENLTWNLTDSVLTISGTGAMTDYDYRNLAPWCDYDLSITSVIIGDSVTSIGQYAFKYCTGLTSIEIPNSVTSIGQYAFEDCRGLTSVTIGNSVTTIGAYAFDDCSGLTKVNIVDLAAWCKISFAIGMGMPLNYASNPLYYAKHLYLNNVELTELVFPDSCTSIGKNVFYNCSGLKRLTFGPSFKLLDENAFANCTSIETITCYSMRPPTVNANALSKVPYSTIVYVPAAYLNNYLMHDAWGLYDVRPMGVALNLSVNNDQYGVVEGAGTYASGSTVTFSAIPNYGYHLDKWSDGNTDNPRTITLTQDTILTAYFAVDKSGTCGKDNILQWSFSEDGKLTISGKGELTANYTFGVEAPTQMKTLIIGNEVTAIGDSAFYKMSSINHLIIGGSVASIGDYAFAECRNFDDITCYAQDVPAINATTFANVGNKQYIYLYVPEDRERAYKRDTYWGEFDVQVKGASETTTDQNVTVTPNENSAIVTWPTEKNAATYTLQITKDGVVFCTLIFNGSGQLIGISFAPSRDGSSHAPAATVSVAGMSFTVTGLSNASKYAYNLSVADDNNQEIVYYQGEFATTGYEGEVVPGGEPVTPGGGTTAIDNVHPSTQSVGTTKFFRNGQLFIQRGNELFNAQGARVK